MDFRKLNMRAGMLGLAALALVGVAAACGDDDDDAKTTPTAAATSSATAPAATSTAATGEAAIRQSMEAINKAAAAGDTDAFLKYITDQGLAQLFMADAEALKGDPSMLQQTPPLEAESIKVDGNKAVAEVNFGGPENGMDAPSGVIFKLDGGTWKVDGVEVLDGKPVSGATTVDFVMDDFSFEFDETKLKAGAQVVFNAKNDGKQMHEMALMKIDNDKPLEELLATEGEPEGVSPVGFAGLFSPNDDAKVALTQPLEAGRYAFVCFIPDVEDPEMAPHAMKGMVTEFKVQ